MARPMTFSTKNMPYSRCTLVRSRSLKDHARFSRNALVADTTVETIFAVSGLSVACRTRLNRTKSTTKLSSPTVPNLATSENSPRIRASSVARRLTPRRRTARAAGSGSHRSSVEPTVAGRVVEQERPVP